MGKSRRFGNDQSFKSHHDGNNFSKKSKRIKWVPKKSYSDRDINRQVRQGDFDDYN